MSGARVDVVTIGEAMMVFNGPPDAPLGVHAPVSATFAGAEANVAIGLARLGHSARVISAVGDDIFGHAILRSLRGEGVNVSGVRLSSDRPTGVMFKDRHDPGRPDVLYYRRGSAFAHTTTETFDPTWRRAGLIYVTGITPALSPGCDKLIHDIVRDARSHQIPVWLDPNFRSKLWDPVHFTSVLTALLPYVDTLLPNEEEARLLTGYVEPKDVAKAFFDKGVRQVVLKAGDRGAFAFSAGEEAHCDRFPLARVVDPIGAGDAFDAGYLSGHLDGLRPSNCLRRAHAVAALVCTTLGDWEGLPTRAQLDRFLAGPTDDQR
jgi:2-dehydro-3-deoxygluconokinase